MALQTTSRGTSAFTMRRMLLSKSGAGSDLDIKVKRHLDELDALLGKPVFRSSADIAAIDPAGDAKKTPVRSGSGDRNWTEHLFSLRLTGKHVPALEGQPSGWDRGSLAAYFADHSINDGYTLGDHIDRIADLAKLKSAFQDEVQQAWALMPYNSRAVLEGYPNITDYLIAYAYHKMDIRDEETLRRVLVNNRAGTQVFSGYAALSAARWMIDRDQLKVDGYNDTDSAFAKKLAASSISLTALSFDSNVKGVIHAFMFDRDEEAILRSAKIFSSLSPDLLPDLVAYLQKSPLKFTTANIDEFLPGIVLQVVKQTRGTGAGSVSAPSDDAFRIQFADDTDDTVAISKAAILCSAQLYHGMVMGDELDVFGAIQYLTNKRMNSFGGMRVESQELSDDLYRYVFDNRYIDLEASKARPAEPPVEKFRTRASERQMFQRQVFDEGHAEMPHDMLANEDFKRLWKVLMLESARFLDKAQASFNPDSFVSRQNVMQAVEDLQYSLSTHCTGMATVLSPAIDAELNFVLERILKHKEVLQQVLPEGGNWKRALDKLNGERRKQAGPATTLYNKAVLGSGIIEMIAEYTPAAFEDDGIFSTFISKVDGFITTQSILQQPKNRHKDGEDEHEDAPGRAGTPPLQPPATGDGAGAPADEWDF